MARDQKDRSELKRLQKLHGVKIGREMWEAMQRAKRPIEEKKK